MLDNLQDIETLSPIPNRPLTVEVIERMEDAVRNGIFQPRQKLPSEPNLARQLGISRNTLREALNSLIEKGVFYRLRGVGTFVAHQSGQMLETSLDIVVSTSEVIRLQGHQPGQRQFEWKVEVLPDDIAKKLLVEPGSQALHISRIRTADQIPVISSEEYIPIDLLKDDQDFYSIANVSNWSIYTFLSHLGYKINSAITHIRAVIADSLLAKVLEIEEGIPILRLEQLHYSNVFPRPVLYCVNFHNDKVIDVVVVRKG